MIELYSVKDVAILFGQKQSRLRYWIQSGFIWPSVRRGGQYFYTFDDLITVRTAVELLETGLSVQKVRKALTELRAVLPEGVNPAANLRICSDGSSLVVIKDDIAYEAESKQLVMAFAVSSINSQIAKVLPIRGKDSALAIPTPVSEEADKTLRQELPSAYQLFLHATQAEEDQDIDSAERYLRQCLALEDSMAAAHTNLGNLLHAQGRLQEAQQEYENALSHQPEQPEARFNLSNLLQERGEHDMAIAELRHVCSRNPDFADAHYNLGILLAEVGGKEQSDKYLEQYLAMDDESQWADQARACLAS